MSRLIKEKVVQQYDSRFRNVTDAAIVSTKGVDVQGMTMLRGALRARGIRAMVVHNRLAKRALAETKLAGLVGLLRGPSTIVWGGESIVDIAKALVTEAKTTTQMEVRGGISGGQILSKADLEALAKMPSREELLGQAVGRVLSPAGRVVMQIRATGGRLVTQVREVEKRAPAETVTVAAEPAPPGAAASPGAEGSGSSN